MKKLFMGVLFTLTASCAFASPLSKLATSIPYSGTGRSVSMGSGPLSAATTANRGVPPGTTQIGQSGWHYGTGATYNPSSGQTMTMGANGDVYLAGTKYPFQAGYSVPVSDVALAALGLIGGWPGLALTGALIAAPHIKDWLDGAGVAPNPNATGDADRFLMFPEGACRSDCYNWQTAGAGGAVDAQTFPTAKAGCEAGATQLNQTLVSVNGSGAVVGCLLASGGSFNVYRLTPRPSDSALPKSMDDIAPYLMRSLMNPGVVSDVIQGGGTINLPDPTVTGPASIQGQPSTSVSTGTQTINGQQVPTRTETTTQTTYNFTTNNNQVTNTTNTTTTTTNTYNTSTGVLISTDTTEKTEEPEEQEQMLDSPLGPVPKLYQQKYPEGITGVWNGKKAEFSQTGFFTMIDQLTPKVGQAGSCPSWTIDLSWTPGGSMGVHQLQPPCMIWPILKAIVIITALFLARALIFGG